MSGLTIRYLYKMKFSLSVPSLPCEILNRIGFQEVAPRKDTSFGFLAKDYTVMEWLLHMLWNKFSFPRSDARRSFLLVCALVLLITTRSPFLTQLHCFACNSGFVFFLHANFFPIMSGTESTDPSEASSCDQSLIDSLTLQRIVGLAPFLRQTNSNGEDRKTQY